MSFLYNRLVWREEFDGDFIDPEVWSFAVGGNGWGNQELQYYTGNRRENARIENGKLVIEARMEAYMGRDYTSARIITKDTEAWKYGRIEARIKLPSGQGIWPAFWTLGADIDSVSWPRCGEIDILEMLGGGEGRDNVIHGTVHWNEDGHKQSGIKYQLMHGNFCDDFHVFSVEWNSNEIHWYVDGFRYNTVLITADMEGILDNPQYILLNIAVGGVWPGSPDASTKFPQRMLVDWIRVYQ